MEGRHSYLDRRDAGRTLANELSAYAGRDDVVVLALPRGGVPVGFEVARALGAPLDVFVVRKLGVPFEEELAMGAIASGGVRVVNQHVVEELGISARAMSEVTRREEAELVRRERLYRGGRPLPQLRGKTAILVDDGLATGTTMRAAIAALKMLGPARVVVAVGVAPAEMCEALLEEVDELVCPLQPEMMFAIGPWYADFSQTTDDEVRALLEQAADTRGASLTGAGAHGP